MILNLISLTAEMCSSVTNDVIQIKQVEKLLKCFDLEIIYA